MDDDRNKPNETDLIYTSKADSTVPMLQCHNRATQLEENSALKFNSEKGNGALESRCKLISTNPTVKN